MMKFAVSIWFLCILSILGCQQNDAPLLPQPTGGSTIINNHADEGENRDIREAWLEAMHRSAPGTDWRYLEYQNQWSYHQQRVAGQLLMRGDQESLANGQLTGRWFERGSHNQAGSVVATTFDPITEDIWLVSAGGSLFKGNLDGKKWEVINQDLVLEGDLLSFIPGNQGERRLLAVIHKIIHYSDDDGVTWEPAEGMSTYDNNWGGRKEPIVLADSVNTIFYLVQEWLSGPWKSDVGLYMSKDRGETFERTWSFQNGDLNNYSMTLIHGTNEILILEKNSSTATSLYQLDTDTGIPALANSSTVFGVGSSTAYAYARKVGNETRLYTYNSANQFYLSTDLGMTWTGLGTIDERPWSVGMHISATNPDFIMVGGVHCHRSIDGGQTFVRFNNWWDYYDNVDGALHADMMYFKEFETSEGTPFFLISNHGGLNVSYDGATVKNLGLQGLNVAQYYDIVTDPLDEIYIYAGSQDQGFQRAQDLWEDDILDFQQAISGDYGHMAFTDYGQRLWMVYPGGWVTYWPSPTGGGYSATFEIDSDDESVWIPPLISHPDPTRNEVFLAGGNAFGGSGSYIIRLFYDAGEIKFEQLPFDFKAFSNGEVSALAFSPHDPLRMYAATTNGYFFTSNDQGMTWDVAQNQVPGGQYLYGASILPCPVDPDRVYFGGSGYSNPPVLVSNDGGFTFTPMSNGLPPTLVYDMTASPDGKMIFAGTQSAPYVYITDEEEWHSMLGANAPVQTYWSVHYLPMQNRVRFGTYGRGIWDFSIEESTHVQSPLPTSLVQKARVVPNPVRGGVFQLQLPGMERDGQVQVSIFNLNGQPLFDQQFSGIAANPSLDIRLPQTFSSGSYVIIASQGKRQWVARFISGG